MLEFSYSYWLAQLSGVCSYHGISTVRDFAVICFSWKLYDNLSYFFFRLKPVAKKKLKIKVVLDGTYTLILL